ncbi:uncharacterized protein BDR25DRAFT_361581 [Lindgomyces ingoldianus]|uniref:Uncharacterized protein n=1 Tax=Lindgomyces ingoldianus TaxID=673940 RepID=A0ACB6QC08_9PLEO|nr:uncharacterized protein BDR25DRAFT_361581 [Lindgomyces ingoldianus]KAF2464503.1 hypothetical protein BDR25DRAFT_361581 [Lindgomyces ingoldianus]
MSAGKPLDVALYRASNGPYYGPYKVNRNGHVFSTNVPSSYNTDTYLSSSLSYERTQNLTCTGLKIAQSESVFYVITYHKLNPMLPKIIESVCEYAKGRKCLFHLPLFESLFVFGRRCFTTAQFFLDVPNLNKPTAISKDGNISAHDRHVAFRFDGYSRTNPCNRKSNHLPANPQQCRDDFIETTVEKTILKRFKGFMKCKIVFTIIIPTWAIVERLTTKRTMAHISVFELLSENGIWTLLLSSCSELLTKLSNFKVICGTIDIHELVMVLERFIFANQTLGGLIYLDYGFGLIRLFSYSSSPSCVPTAKYPPVRDYFTVPLWKYGTNNYSPCEGNRIGFLYLELTYHAHNTGQKGTLYKGTELMPKNDLWVLVAELVLVVKDLAEVRFKFFDTKLRSIEICSFQGTWRRSSSECSIVPNTAPATIRKSHILLRGIKPQHCARCWQIFKRCYTLFCVAEPMLVDTIVCQMLLVEQGGIRMLARGRQWLDICPLTTLNTCHKTLQTFLVLERAASDKSSCSSASSPFHELADIREAYNGYKPSPTPFCLSDVTYDEKLERCSLAPFRTLRVGELVECAGTILPNPVFSQKQGGSHSPSGLRIYKPSTPSSYLRSNLRVKNRTSLETRESSIALDASSVGIEGAATPYSPLIRTLCACDPSPRKWTYCCKYDFKSLLRRGFNQAAQECMPGCGNSVRQGSLLRHQAPDIGSPLKTGTKRKVVDALNDSKNHRDLSNLQCLASPTIRPYTTLGNYDDFIGIDENGRLES